MHHGPSQGHRDKAPPPASPGAPRAPLHEAAACGDDQLVAHLLSAGADRNHKDAKHGNTPLHEAAWRGHSRCVRALCALPARPTAGGSPKDKSKQVKSAIAQTQGSLHSALLGTRNTGGFSALHLAAQNGHNQSCREILLAGGDANVQNNYGDSPLHTACRYGHAGATRILLSGNADPLRVNLNGDSALHIACAMGRRKLTRILLSAGGSAIIRNAQNETARDICVRKKLPEILEILDAPPDVHTKQPLDRDRSSSSSKHKDRRSNNRAKANDTAKQALPNRTTPKTKTSPADETKYNVNAKHWSPYGCHYFPDPKSFPSPKLETLPKEPLGNGEQYYLDLAGNIRKGPVGVGNTCYCGPFFRHIEDKISRNKKSIKKYVHKATEKLDNKVQALALKTDDQIEQITRQILADRIHCDGQRLHLEQWLKRGDKTRATVAAHTSKSRKDETNTNTLTRCRSLELLDSNAYVETMQSCAPGLSKSFDLLNGSTTHHRVEVHAEYHPSEDEDNHDDAYVQQAVRTNQTADTQRTHYYLDSDKEWQYHGSSKNESSDKERLSSISGRVGKRLSSSEKDRNSLEGRSDSDMSRNARLLDPKSGVSVAARLEELLSKTNEIIEMERVARKKNSEVFSMFAADKTVNKRLYSKYSLESKDQSRLSESRVSSGGGRSTAASGTYEDSLINQSTSRKMSNGQNSKNDSMSQQIAHEMEKITSSLLGSSLRDNQRHLPSEALDQAPVSPEIAKEYISKKEQKMSRMKEQESRSLLSDASQQSLRKPEVRGLFVTPSKRNDMRREAINGYRSSSSRSIGTPPNRILNEESPTTPAAADPASFGSFYQNTTFENGHGSANGSFYSDEQHDDNDAGSVDTEDERLELSEMANMQALNELKSRILNGAHWRDQLLIKGLSEVVDEQIGDNPAALSLPVRNRVQELVAKLQSSSQRLQSGDGVYGQEHDEQSESSDEDDESVDEDEDEVDGDAAMGYTADGSDVLEMLPMEREPPQTTQRTSRFESTNYANRPPSGTRPKPFVELPDYSSEFIPISTPSIGASSLPLIDTRYLIPKDAYFHELPHRSRTTCPIPEKIASQNYGTTSFTNNNPQPSHTFVPPSTSSCDPPEFAKTLLVTSRPIFYQSHHVLPPPQREKLLSNRKFAQSHLPPVTPPSQQTHLFADRHLPETGVTHFMNIDQVQMERDANNDSGFSTRLSGGSQNGHSPNLSGRVEQEAALIGGHRPIVERGGGDEYPRMQGVHDERIGVSGGNHFEPYFMANIGASSLV